MLLWGEENLRDKEGSGSGDANVVEGLIRLRNSFQEHVSSMQEPLEDMLKRVSDKYNPKRKKSSGVKIPGTARANEKRKVASSIPLDTPPTRGNSRRSQKKQSEAELEKALEKSQRKVVAKGKKKVSEPVEAVEIEEMDLVLHDEEETEEVEKSHSKTKSAKPSTLAKRTRSAVKSRKVKVVEKEKSEEEEEYDEEVNKMVKFGKRTILKGRLLRDLEEADMMMLLEKLQL
ncbi:uncharacterized protein [Nicotiana tomentosiformis]|uniref:uncharacterized protein n=1 Tax=Nicotiana tomentosiformis TaxID=4098 RepID=UPI00388C9215